MFRRVDSGPTFFETGSKQVPSCDKSTRRVKFRFSRNPNHRYESPHPVPEEGALAIVTERWDGMRWTRRHRARNGIAGRDKLRERSQDGQTSGVVAYGKSVWTRCLKLVGVKSCEVLRPDRAGVPVSVRRRRRQRP